MRKIKLGYGRNALEFAFDEYRFEVLQTDSAQNAISDADIGAAFDSPIGSPNLEEIVSANEKILIVVPDATRASAAGQVVNLLVRRLIANGSSASDISIIFATGIHRAVTEEEKREILTPFIAQRIKTLDHDARNLACLSSLGETQSGIPVEMNRALFDNDRVIIIGGISFHYFAGFTGGRKLICPGLASTRTVSETHKRAFDFERKTRREGVGTGLLKGNAVHEAFVEVVEKIPPSFSVNTIVNDLGDVTEIFVGDWKLAHESACDSYVQAHTVSITQKRDLVIASCGGFPFDLNMIQAHKTLEAASHACKEGRDIILLAECADGLGRNDFLKWFAAKDSTALAEKLCEGYQVNGQTAWNLLRIAERFNVYIITNLSDEETRQMRMQKARSIEECVSKIKNAEAGFILPSAAKCAVNLSI